MFSKFIEAIFGIQDGKSWIDLDDRMRGQLRFWGASSVFVLVFLVLSSLYFYLQWPPVKQIVDQLWGNVQKSVADKGEIPAWIITVGTAWLVATFVLSLFFFYLLIDLAKVHYKIDAVTFRIIPKVNEYIRSTMLARLACPVADCALRQLVLTPSGTRRFRDVVFYHFANQDQIGAHNQADKRRQVFGFWTQYYVFNYIMVIVLLCWLWLCFLALMNVSTTMTTILVVLTAVIVVLWRSRGRKYRQGALDLAADQIDAFFNHARPQVVTQAASLVSQCTNRSCQVKPNPLRTP
jgi:hypothetical protein